MTCRNKEREEESNRKEGWKILSEIGESRNSRRGKWKVRKEEKT